MTHPDGVEVLGPAEPRFDEILTDESLAFVAGLQREFGGRRDELLEARAERQARLDEGERPDFLDATRSVREADWRVGNGAARPGGPPCRDHGAHRPEDGDQRPEQRRPLLHGRPRGRERSYLVEHDPGTDQHRRRDPRDDRDDGSRRPRVPARGRDRHAARSAAGLAPPRTARARRRAPVSGSLFDFGLAFFHNAREQLERDTGPYFYLPKLEGHLEARLWNDVFVWAQDRLGDRRAARSARPS